MKKNNTVDYSKVGINLNYNHMMFEVTRQCNLKCEHCMRGDAQNITMSKEIIDKTLDQIGYCCNFGITGGEPFLVPDTIEYLVDGIIKRKKKFASFSLVVNGTIFDDRAIKSINAINKIASYYYKEIMPDAYRSMENKEYSFERDFENNPNRKEAIVLTISEDEFHKNNVEEAIAFYKKYANKYVIVNKQSEWTTELKDDRTILRTELRVLKSEHGKTWVNSEGRAEQNHIGYKKNSCEHCANICHRIYLKECVECSINISANGNVCVEGELSFEHNDKYSMGNVLESPISCMIVDWQWKEPLECKEVHAMLELKSILDYDKYTDDFYKVSEDVKKTLQHCVNLMGEKRKTLIEAHKHFPYLPYNDLVNMVDADFNIRTNGEFAEYMRLYYDGYKEKYPSNWKYNVIKEQSILHTYKKLNRKLALKNGDFSYLNLKGAKNALFQA